MIGYKKNIADDLTEVEMKRYTALRAMMAKIEQRLYGFHYLLYITSRNSQ